MTDCCAPNSNANDLTSRKIAWLLWYLPAALVIAGFSWPVARGWLWIPALLIAGGGCMANAARCGRWHCYFTGPLYILGALYLALALPDLVPLNAGLFWIVVLVVSCLSQCLEIPLGKYRRGFGRSA
ncbi:MAG: hypothetical protein ACM3SW_12425 [Actinomycetota bacterium]